MNTSASCSSQSIGPASQLLGLLIQSLFADQCGLIPDWPTDFGPNFSENDAYDFIVVGSGTAGSIVAGRLSENPDWNVLLLEAGGDPPIDAEIPAIWITLDTDEINWNYNCEPSTTASLSLKNESSKLSRAKLLGGCGEHNANLYNRGNENDYNGWAEAGNPTWSWDNVLPYFKKAEDNQDAKTAANTFYHSVNGPVKVNNYGFAGAGLDLIEDLFAEMGFPYIEDINADQHLGYGTVQGTIENGVRYSTARAYLIPANNRTNLKIIKNAQVTTLNINADRSVAGVNFVLNGKTRTVSAKKEVILSAGTVGTPVILLNSGIGPAQHLRDMNIPLIKDLSVGQNLQDHTLIFYPMAYQSDVPGSDQVASYYQYLTNRTGDFSNVGTDEFTAYFSTTNDPKFPDIEYYGVNFAVNDTSLEEFLGYFNYNDETIESMQKINENSHMIVFLIAVINPKSRGHIELQSNNPLEYPKIYPNLLSDPADVQTMIKGIRQLQTINATQSFTANSGEFVRVPLTDCDTLAFDSDDYWECYSRHLSTIFLHTVGTSKMGPVWDRDAVVDARLNVKGIRGLRVIDASIMPTVVSGPTNAAVIMIGEKGADLVKEDWTKPSWNQFRNVVFSKFHV